MKFKRSWRRGDTGQMLACGVGIVLEAGPLRISFDKPVNQPQTFVFVSDPNKAAFIRFMFSSWEVRESAAGWRYFVALLPMRKVEDVLKHLVFGYE